MSRNLKWSLVPALLIGIWLAMMATGTGPLDRALLDFLYAAHRPALQSAATFVTLLGEWQFLFPLTLIVGGLLLIVARARRQAILFLSICLFGRLLVHLQKIGIGRLRPEDREHLVPVNSLSFPSGHSTNSMIVFLALALVVAPARHRQVAVLAALLTSMIVGISRPMLGVHWPSDVLGGWSFGAAWVLLMVGMAERWPFQREAAKIEVAPTR
ncbi:MAG: phosphatase PAP2 family protein [Sphingomicrobium sp.]